MDEWSRAPSWPRARRQTVLTEHYRAMARYNRWMNRRVYDASAGLDDGARRRDLGAFFRSIHGTLNHLLLADRVWLARLTGDPARGESRARDGSLIALRGLDQELYHDFDELRREREKTDEELSTWVEGLSEADVRATLRYHSLAGHAIEHPMWFALSHAFNHQTHHRGQVTTLLMQLGVDPGVTDLVAMLRSEMAPP
jgi:uncharacterized damage-inducible protein DinB